MSRFLAESARTRCALLLATAVTAGTAIVAAATSSSPAPQADEPRAHVHKMRGCGTKARAAATAPVQAEDPYVATLRSARPAFEACMQDADGVQIRLALDISATGRVENVEVRTMADDVAKIDMRIVKCVQTAVSGLTFPASDGPTRISTFLRP